MITILLSVKFPLECIYLKDSACKKPFSILFIVTDYLEFESVCGLIVSSTKVAFSKAFCLINM